ncbi:MAG: response regulator, partial [Burkholderiaceae bacterium]
MSVFIIDDHPLIRDAVAMVLRRLRPSGLPVIELERLGQVAQAVAEHGEPAVILIDLKLPDTHGVSGVRELRRMLPVAKLVVFSASSATDY